MDVSPNPARSADVAEPAEEAVALGVKRAPRGVVDQEMVDRDLEALGELDDGVGRGQGLAVLPAAHLVSTGRPHFVREVVLGPALFSSVLLALLDDEDVAAYAVMGLGKLKAREARPAVERFLDHPESWVRKEAKRALAKLPA